MASWMVHLRIADKLLLNNSFLKAKEFIIGNMAPDSGVPNDDWSKFSPPTKISHFKVPKENGKLTISLDKYKEKYFTPSLLATYTTEQYSFYVGYLAHLLTDLLWIERVFNPTANKDPHYSTDPSAAVNEWKKDWYDLDFLYLYEHPDFHAFAIYRSAEDFKNTFMEEFSIDAFDNRRAYICEFYSEDREGLYREYPYLTAAQMDDFVEYAAEYISKEIFNNI
jgi:hypothetical protein